jgi:hypothetical protein
MRKQIRNMRRSSRSTLCLEADDATRGPFHNSLALASLFWSRQYLQYFKLELFYLYLNVQLDRLSTEWAISIILPYNVFRRQSAYAGNAKKFIPKSDIRTETYAHMQGSGVHNMAFNCSHGGCPPTINELFALYARAGLPHTPAETIGPRKSSRGPTAVICTNKVQDPRLCSSSA